MHGSRLNRRQFLSATASSLVLAGCGTPKPKHVDPTGVVDTHTHFYDPSRPRGVPWPPPTDTFLYRPVFPEEFQNLTRRHGVTGTVVVEASSWLEDNQWILDLAEKNDFILGFVGRMEPGRPEFAADVKRFTANPVFRGIRIGVWEKSPLANPDVVRDLRLLADLDLSLDILTDADRLEEVARLAHAIPALRIVVDHCANVRIEGQGPPVTWLKGLQACAPHRNIYMKVSGLVEGTGRKQSDAPSNLEFYRPTVEAVWQAFGEYRVLYGSNWPVSARFAPYATVFNLVAEFFNGKGTAAAERFFAKNAVKAYKIAAR
jgi:L-fuconolactonase